jgi:hypothetical protein
MPAQDQVWPIAPGELPRDGRLTADLQQYNPRLVLLSGATINRAGGLIRPSLANDARREAAWWRFPGANGYIDLGAEYLVAHNAHTLISVHECSALTAGFGLLTSYQTAVATRISLFYSSDASYSDISVGEVGGGGTSANRQRFTMASGQTRTGQRHSMVMRRAGDGQHAMWINGQRLTASNGSSFASPTGNSVIGNASPGSLANDWQGRVFAFVLLDGLVPDDLAQAISAQPAAMLEPVRIFVPGGAGGSTGRTLTTSLSAAIQQAHALTAGLSSAVQSTATVSASANLAVQAATAATAGLNAAVQQARTAVTGLDVAVRTTGAQNTALSAALQLARSATAALELAVQAQVSATASVNLQVQAGSTVSTSVSLQVQAGNSASVSLSMAVLQQALSTVGLNLAVLNTGTSTVGLSAALQAARNAATAIDMAVQMARTASASLNLQVQAGTTLSAQIEAAVQQSSSAVVGVQAAIAQAASANLSLGAAVMVQRSVAAAVNAFVEGDRSVGSFVTLLIYDPSGATPDPVRIRMTLRLARQLRMKLQ